MTPVDLKSIAGNLYKLELDPAAADEPRSERLWYLRIPCRRGFISPHGPGLLAGYGTGRAARRLTEIPGVRVHQRGDREARILFGPEHLDAVAAVLGARRRRRLTDAQRDRLATAGQRNRFQRRTEPVFAPS